MTFLTLCVIIEVHIKHIGVYLAEDKPSKSERLGIRQERFKFHLDYGVNVEERVVLVTGSIGEDTSFDAIDAALTALERESKMPITVRIFSGGGSVSEALAIIGRLTASPCEVVTEAYGQVASAACLILACGNVRRMSRFTTFLHHESSTWLSGKTTFMKEELEQLEREEDQWCNWLAEMSKLSAKQWRQKATKREFYMTAHECLEAGIVDELI